MGGELERRAVSSPQQSLTALFEEVCPFYMSIGMTYKDFWEGDVRLPGFFLRAYKLKCERDLEENNFNAWLQGRYIHDAFAVVLSNAFSDRHSSPSQYHEKPIEIKQREKSEEEKEKEREAARLRVKIALDNFTAAINGSKATKKQEGK